MFRPFFYFFFIKVFGWKITGSFPAHLKKYIVAVAPHTSSWDFPIGLAVRSIMRMQNTRFLAKASLFKPPLGWLFRLWGGYPVDRSKSSDMTHQVSEIFAAHEQFILGIAPEGTRKKVDKLKTGFYYIARTANVPIVPCGFDFGRREVIIGTPFYPSDDVKLDIDSLTSFYGSIQGRNPELGIGWLAE